MSAPANQALPARLDLSSATELALTLRALQGEDLVLDAAAVTHLGTPGVQVLLSARRSWAEAGQALLVEHAGSGVEEQLRRMGLSLADLTTGEMPASDGAADDSADLYPADMPPDAPLVIEAGDGDSAPADDGAPADPAGAAALPEADQTSETTEE